MQFTLTIVFASSEAIEELVVTGTHVPLAHEEIGSSYTIITAQDIAQRQAVLVSDLLRDVPGFAVSRSGVVGSQTQVRVRGSEANHLLVLIDGIEANDVTSSEFDFAHLLTSNIERIEIIRGPQSALYGSDALAGVINIITKQGKGITKLSSTLEIGVPNSIHANGNISAGTDHYHYNLQATYVKSAGHNIALNGDEEDAYKNTTLNLNVGANPIDNLNFNVVARHVSAANETDSIFEGKVVDADQESKVSQNYLSGQISYNNPENTWQHRLNVSLNQSNNDTFSSGMKTNHTEGQKVRFNYQMNFHAQTNVFADASHIFTFSADHEANSFEEDGFGQQKQNLQNTGIIAGYRIGLAKKLFFSTSIRKDNNSDFKNAITHRHTLAYILPSLNMRLHSSYGIGIKNPTFVERFGFIADFVTFRGNPNLKPEKSKSWDVGIDKSIWHDRMTLGVVYFNAKLQDEINGLFFFFDEMEGIVVATAVNLDATSNREGIEIATDIQLTDSIELKASYTWTHAQEIQREVRRPKHIASLNIGYISPSKMTKINLNTTFTGQQQDNVFLNGASERVTLDDYILVNIAASYSISPKIDLYGRIENLFDEQYQDVFSFATPGITGIIGLHMAF